MITLDTLREMAGRLPGAAEESWYGTPAFKVGKKGFARLHQKEDAIVLLLDSVARQQELIARDPVTYYITDHYAGHAGILVRPMIDDDEFFPLFEHAWRQVAGKSNIEEYERRS